MIIFKEILMVLIIIAVIIRKSKDLWEFSMAYKHLGLTSFSQNIFDASVIIFCLFYLFMIFSGNIVI
jgi:hypothetical protein